MKNSDVRIASGEPVWHPVPCGKCLFCRKNKQQDWAFRQYAESLNPVHKSLFFVTLTIDDDHLVRNRYGRYSVYKSSLQDFFDRLRYYLPEGHNLRYMACGEYGDTFSRPHYHFNAFLDVDMTEDEFHLACTKAWKFCIPDELIVEPFDLKSAEYVAKYCTKRPGVDYDKNKVNSPFLLASRRPAIGKYWLDTQHAKLHQSLLKTLVYDSSGTPYNMPRYLREKLFSDDDKLLLTKINEQARQDMFEFKAFQSGLSVDQVEDALHLSGLSAESTALKAAEFKKIQLDFLSERFQVDKVTVSKFTCEDTEVRGMTVPPLSPSADIPVNEDF